MKHFARDTVKLPSLAYGKPSLPEAYLLVNTGPNSFQYHQVREIDCMVSCGRVTKMIWSVLEMYGRVLESYQIDLL